MEVKPQGQIKGVSLTALLQMFEMEKTTCALKVSCAQDTGILFLSEGELIAAKTSRLEKIDAAHEIIRWEEVSIEFAEFGSMPQRNIHQPMMTILMDGLRLKDEGATPADSAESSLIPPPSEAAETGAEQDDALFPELSLDLEDEAEENPQRSRLLPDKERRDSADRAGRRVLSRRSDLLTEEAVEKKIAEFVQKIAMSCPLCGLGRILAHPADKDRTYYGCNHPECRFISWEKPYAFRCPQCANPYLLEWEVQGGESGELGLKCPKPGCGFQQSHLYPPGAQNESDVGGGKVKKLVRVVKRKE